MDKKYTIEQLRQVKGIGEKTIQRIVEQFDESELIQRRFKDNVNGEDILKMIEKRQK